MNAFESVSCRALEPVIPTSKGVIFFLFEFNSNFRFLKFAYFTVKCLSLDESKSFFQFRLNSVDISPNLAKSARFRHSAKDTRKRHGQRLKSRHLNRHLNRHLEIAKNRCDAQHTGCVTGLKRASRVTP